MLLRVNVYLEIGSKKTFAGALDWPGWCRAGKGEAGALAALFHYADRYRRALQSSGLEFAAPGGPDELAVVERLPGDASTDFGAPGKIPSADRQPMGSVDLERAQAVLSACWSAFAAAARSARGKELRTGPRGGGRQLEAMIRHVLEAEGAYLARLGWKSSRSFGEDWRRDLARLQQAGQEALAAAAGGRPPERGPRGGVRWPPRYYLRRSAWHILDHAWEIEDRR
jgi:hypothetical protein